MSRGRVSSAVWYCPGHVKLAIHKTIPPGMIPCPLCCGFVPKEDAK